MSLRGASPALPHSRREPLAYLAGAALPLRMRAGTGRSGGECTRRRALYVASGAFAAACSAPTRAHERSPRAAADFVLRNCRAFLRARGDADAVMWRGGDGVGSVRPPPDLLDEAVYGQDGVRYFRALAECPELEGLPIATAHIGTGSKVCAAGWGEPVSVWPIDSVNCDEKFDFFFWEGHQVIWNERRDGACEGGAEALHRNGALVRGDRLGEALTKEKEVLFAVHERGFLTVGEADTPALVSELRRLSNTLKADLKP